MKRPLVLALLVLFILVVVGVGSAAYLFASNDPDNDQRFCDSARQWHATFSDWLRRVNTEGARHDDALKKTYDVLKPHLNVVLEEGSTSAEKELRELLRNTTKHAEAWMSDLSQSDAPLALKPPDLQLFLEYYRRSELERIEGNDLEREASSPLNHVCKTGPLPIYSQ